LQENGKDLPGVRVLVEGVGKVSTHLMRMIVATGARVVGVSTILGSVFDENGIDIEELLSLREEHGDACVKFYRSLSVQVPEDLYLQQADVLIPGARANSINERNVDVIQARFIVPIANISTSPRMEKLLFDRGISYIPGFVTNSGGIFCWYLARLSPEARESVIRQGYARKIRRLIDTASRRQLPIAVVARLQAQNNANRMVLEGSTLFHRIAGKLRKLSPRRSVYIALSKILGSDWSRKDTLFCKSYFNARYFR
jgi:glutamate dehydrogenase/leucine dehydrogenase